VTSTAYDRGSNVTLSTDLVGDKTTFVYDELNPKTVTIDARLETVEWR
jgi:hypothetical protein